MTSPCRGEGGIKELLSIAYPLIISTASNTVTQFINRVFLSRYSADAPRRAWDTRFQMIAVSALAWLFFVPGLLPARLCAII